MKLFSLFYFTGKDYRKTNILTSIITTQKQKSLILIYPKKRHILNLHLNLNQELFHGVSTKQTKRVSTEKTMPVLSRSIFNIKLDFTVDKNFQKKK